MKIERDSGNVWHSFGRVGSVSVCRNENTFLIMRARENASASRIASATTSANNNNIISQHHAASSK